MALMLLIGVLGKTAWDFTRREPPAAVVAADVEEVTLPPLPPTRRGKTARRTPRAAPVTKAEVAAPVAKVALPVPVPVPLAAPPLVAAALPEPEVAPEPEPTLTFDGNGEQIARAIANAKRSAVQKCFERELKRSPDLKGTVHIELDLAPPQQVNDVRVTDDLERPELTRCVTAAMQRLNFVGLNEEVTIHLPYVLSAHSK